MTKKIKTFFLLWDGVRMPNFCAEFPEISQFSQIQEIDADSSIFEVHADQAVFEAMVAMPEKYEVIP